MSKGGRFGKYGERKREKKLKKIKGKPLRGRDIINFIEQIDPEVRPRGVIGGPPCQSFSLSNVHNKPKDPKRLLPLHYANILKTLNKKYYLDFFVFENVVGLKSKKHKEHFGKILKALEDLDFGQSQLTRHWPSRKMQLKNRIVEQKIRPLRAIFGPFCLF